jgi:hypothetical protein
MLSPSGIHLGWFRWLDWTLLFCAMSAYLAYVAHTQLILGASLIVGMAVIYLE